MNIISQSINQSYQPWTVVHRVEHKKLKCFISFREWTVVSCLVRDEYMSSICGHWDHCVIWKRSMGSVSGQVVSTMCVCVCLSCNRLWECHCPLSNSGLPAEISSNKPSATSSCCIPTTPSQCLNTSKNMLYRYPMRDYRNDYMKNIRAYRSDGTANSYRMTHTLTNAEWPCNQTLCSVINI